MNAYQYMKDPDSWYIAPGQVLGPILYSSVGGTEEWDPRDYEGIHRITPENTGVEMTVVEIEIGADLVEKLWGPGARDEWLTALDQAKK